MKKPRFSNAIGNLDDDLIEAAAECKRKKKPNLWLKWGSVAACFTLMLVATLTVMPMLLGEEGTVDPPDNGPGNEYQYESGYFYQVNEGVYSTYVGGKVIEEDKIGDKLADVNLTAGWKDDKGEWKSETEALRGEVYGITGVSNEVAVALKFIDKGEAVTTTHYYVIMNLAEDLTPVKDYIITSTKSENDGVVKEGEVLEGKLEKYYDYGIDNGDFAAYITGKVIGTDKVSARLEFVTVTGGWKSEAGEWISTEVLNAEVFEIVGIDSDIAVALKFIDQGEAVTTTHYYVMINPAADMSIVEEYVREPIAQNDSGDELAGEV